MMHLTPRLKRSTLKLLQRTYTLSSDHIEPLRGDTYRGTSGSQVYFFCDYTLLQTLTCLVDSWIVSSTSFNIISRDPFLESYTNPIDHGDEKHHHGFRTKTPKSNVTSSTVSQTALAGFFFPQLFF